TLNEPAPADGIRVGLSSSHPAVAGLSTDAVKVAAGARSAGFTVSTKKGVEKPTAVAITALFNGQQTLTLTLQPPAAGPVNPGVRLAAVDLEPGKVEGGKPAQGTLILSGPAPEGGIRVALSVGKATAAEVDANVTIEAGQLSKTFPVRTRPVKQAE